MDWKIQASNKKSWSQGGMTGQSQWPTYLRREEEEKEYEEYIVDST